MEIYIYFMYILYGLLTDGEQDIHLADKDVLAVGVGTMGDIRCIQIRT